MTDSDEPDIDFFEQEEYEKEPSKARLLDAIKIIERLAERKMTLDEDSTSPIYQIAHISRYPSCFKTHGEWEVKFQKLASELLSQREDGE